MIPTLILSAATMIPTPQSWLLDCGTWPGGAPVKLCLEFTSAAGQEVRMVMHFEPDITPAQVRNGFNIVLIPDTGTRKAGQSTLIVESYKGAPVRVLKVTSDQWAPHVRPLFTPQPPKP